MSHALILAILLQVPASVPAATSQEPASSNELRIVAEAQPAVRLTGLHAKLRVEGPIMKVEQQLVLRNPGSEAQGFDLVFPLGRAARLTGLTLTADGRALTGTLLDADEARRLYKTTLKADGDPALLEHYGEALYRARVQPIPAQEERTLVLTYERMVEREGDLGRLHLPLTAFHRVAGPVDLSIKGELVTEEPVSGIYSPTHAIELDAETASYEASRTLLHTHFRVDVTMEQCETDFLAYYQPRKSALSHGAPFDVTVLSERTSAQEDGTFLALVRGLRSDALDPEPKNVVFVVDRSGSMQNEKIEQARSALRYLVGQLRPEDRFNIVSYASETSVFAETLQLPSPDTIERAQIYIDGIAADGGTGMEAALRAALAQFGPESDDSGGTAKRGVLGQIVFLTDGRATDGETDERKLCSIVRENNPHEVRVIAFGLGFNVNGSLLDRLAAQNHGMSEYVLPDQPVEEKITGFYERMHAPLMRDAVLTVTGVEVHDVFPREVGDLYVGHDLMLVGRYKKPGAIQLTVVGQRGLELEEHAFRFELAKAGRDGRSDYIGRLWAARKIGYLVDELRIEEDTEPTPMIREPDPRIAEIVRLGRRYGILTEYTAFLAGEGTDLYAFGDNVLKCTSEIWQRTSVVSGSHGVAQACNSKTLQRSNQVAKNNTWLDASGQEVTVGGVSCVNGKTFFQRGDTWQDTALVTAEVDETIELFSDDFFALLDRNPWLGACVARTGDLVVGVEGKNVRIGRERL